jgi:hypothetical protein
MKRMVLARKRSKSSGSSPEQRSGVRESMVKFALCIAKDKDSADLHLATLYPLLADKKAAKEGFLRIIDDSGDDYLYPAEYFVIQRLRSSLAKKIGHRASR